MNTPYKQDFRTKRFRWRTSKSRTFQLYESTPQGYVSIDVFGYRGNAQRAKEKLERINPDKNYIIIGRTV